MTTLRAETAADRLARALLVLATGGAILAFGVWLTGGGLIEIAGLSIRLRRVDRLALLVLAGVAGLILLGAERRRRALAWLWDVLERRAAAIAVVTALVAAAVAWTYRTDAAGGSDSFCYLNQAELIASGRVWDAQPLAAIATWPDPIATVVPAGHVPAPGGAAAIVPMCPAGYPLMLAAARLVGGRPAMFVVVPMATAVMVWLTFLLARRAGGGRVGAIAALWLATSAAFLHQSFQPMSDIPAAMFWAAALWLASSSDAARAHPAFAPEALRRGRPIIAGVMTGAALLVRPNLAPLAVVIAALLASEAWRRGGSIVPVLVRYGAGALPGLGAILVLQRLAYGGALSTGYGNLGGLFAAAQVMPNLSRYSGWLAETWTPAIALVLVAPVLAPPAARRVAWWLLIFAAATLLVYLPYLVFEGWWFLRFLLPAYPALFTLLALVAVRALAALPPLLRGAATTTVAGAIAAVLLYLAIGHGVFRARDFEQRFRDTGAYLSTTLPAGAVVFAHDLGGAVRFYTGRPTLQWKALDPTWLDRAIATMRARSLPVFLAFEIAEEEMFRQRFGSLNEYGRLDWPPRADINHLVRIYDAADRERAARGEVVETTVIRTR